ncbi:hypothetical protein PG989_012649 [Apiospora arundinis]
MIRQIYPALPDWTWKTLVFELACGKRFAVPALQYALPIRLFEVDGLEDKKENVRIFNIAVPCWCIDVYPVSRDAVGFGNLFLDAYYR